MNIHDSYYCRWCHHINDPNQITHDDTSKTGLACKRCDGSVQSLVSLIGVPLTVSVQNLALLSGWLKLSGYDADGPAQRAVNAAYEGVRSVLELIHADASALSAVFPKKE